MADLIDRQAAIDRFQNLSYDDWNQGVSTTWANAFAECAEMIRELPSADAVEIVWCKDCRYGRRFFDVINGITDSWIECRNPDGLNRDTSEDSFCSCGERKDD